MVDISKGSPCNLDHLTSNAYKPPPAPPKEHDKKKYLLPDKLCIIYIAYFDKSNFNKLWKNIYKKCWKIYTHMDRRRVRWFKVTCNLDVWNETRLIIFSVIIS
jgi:hypothetical protein